MSSNKPAHGWHIVQFIENSKIKQQTTDILLTSDSSKSIEAECQDFQAILHRSFDYLGDINNGDFFRIKHLFVVDASGQELEITSKALVTYLRGLPHSLIAQKPDLLGLGTNKIRVEFEYLEYEW
ncbi:hypothetical protein FN846DRAFT_971114 [Sphaerosporella brunnea]|uniref:Uncharacterized protein n=1 Tax=Sphaerosporella brunnea TaxID=1250544 RepID=A0A5J5EIX1_9PEZI|nr:hypothetical protein FN846DRAFT_971114 [Sphaerosporella brunnea]